MSFSPRSSLSRLIREAAHGASRGPVARGASTWRRWCAVAVVAAGTLAACGGGTSQQEPFVAGRVLAFGDDLSTLDADGKKYSVNGLDADDKISCASEPIWVQSVAGFYGFVFAECNPGGTGNVGGVMRAAAGAKVADIAAQVDAQLAAGGFRDQDLALVMGGINDIKELYELWIGGTVSSAALLTESRARGGRMAEIVNRLITLQAKVIVSTLPDMGISPLAGTDEANRAGRAAFLTELTRAFNEQLGVKVLLDGRFVGLMQTDLRSEQITRFPANYGFSNISTAVCTIQPPGCTTATVLADVSHTSYLWADETRLSSAGQSQLATLALERAVRNPF